MNLFFHPDTLLDNTPSPTTDIILDGHNDLLISLRVLYGNHIYGTKFTDKMENGGLEMHVDLPRLDQGKVGGAFWSAFVPCPANGSDFSDENYAPCMCLLSRLMSFGLKLTRTFDRRQNDT